MLLPTRPSPATDAVLTMAPRARRSAGAAAWLQRNGPSRLVARMVCQNFSVMASRLAKAIGALVPGARVVRQMVHRDGGAAGEQKLDRGEPDARGAARDQRRLAAEIRGDHGFLPRLWWGPARPLRRAV